MPSTQAQRILLTDKAVKNLPFSPAKPQIVRDSKIAGFHLWVANRLRRFATNMRRRGSTASAAPRWSNGSVSTPTPALTKPAPRPLKLWRCALLANLFRAGLQSPRGFPCPHLQSRLGGLQGRHPNG